MLVRWDYLKCKSPVCSEALKAMIAFVTPGFGKTRSMGAKHAQKTVLLSENSQRAPGFQFGFKSIQQSAFQMFVRGHWTR